MIFTVSFVMAADDEAAALRATSALGVQARGLTILEGYADFAALVEQAKAVAALRTELEQAKLHSIEASNPGIDMDEVRRHRAETALRSSLADMGDALDDALDACEGTDVTSNGPSLHEIDPALIGALAQLGGQYGPLGLLRATQTWYRSQTDNHSNMVAHARRELELAGNDPETVDAVCAVVQAFTDFGHSEGSALWTVETLERLLRFKPLSDLTANPAEWTYICDERTNGEELWQSQRDSEAFSHDGGVTYYLLSEKEAASGDLAVTPMHRSLQ